MSDTVAAPAETGNSKWLDWIEKVGNKVVPVLERVADGEPIDEELRIELTHAEAAVRDRIRVPHLQHPLLVAEISRLRRLGVAVAAAVCAVAMAASLATHAGAAGDRRY